MPAIACIVSDTVPGAQSGVSTTPRVAAAAWARDSHGAAASPDRARRIMWLTGCPEQSGACGAWASRVDDDGRCLNHGARTPNPQRPAVMSYVWESSARYSRRATCTLLYTSLRRRAYSARPHSGGGEC